MKLWLMGASAALALAAGSAPAFADNPGNPATIDGHGSVTVIDQLNLAEGTQLNFGSITSGTSQGTVAVSSANARSSTGGVVLVGTTSAAGAFTVTGTANTAITVQIGSAISGFAGSSITGTTSPGTLPTTTGTGTAGFSVGGSLTIPASTPSGTFSGTYTVSANYN